MSFMDKVKFWKKDNDDDFSLPPLGDDPIGNKGNDPMNNIGNDPIRPIHDPALPGNDETGINTPSYNPHGIPNQQSMPQHPMQQNNLPNSNIGSLEPSMPNQNNSDFNNQNFGMNNDNFSREQPRQGNMLQKELEIISSKLDYLKATLDNINHRLERLEHDSDGRNYKW
ncbi:hypothetical protein GF327_06670 [Candidatus Woesearchaeota archaeon]|nr:hypothetical protein [Candidatus Woesearchaeota archaeon]